MIFGLTASTFFFDIVADFEGWQRDLRMVAGRQATGMENQK